jgi:hypothetical protein
MILGARALWGSRMPSSCVEPCIARFKDSLKNNRKAQAHLEKRYVSFSATKRSPMSKLGYMDSDGMKRGSATNLWSPPYYNPVALREKLKMLMRKALLVMLHQVLQAKAIWQPIHMAPACNRLHSLRGAEGNLWCPPQTQCTIETTPHPYPSIMHFATKIRKGTLPMNKQVKWCPRHCLPLASCHCLQKLLQ